MHCSGGGKGADQEKAGPPHAGDAAGFTMSASCALSWHDETLVRVDSLKRDRRRRVQPKAVSCHLSSFLFLFLFPLSSHSFLTKEKDKEERRKRRIPTVTSQWVAPGLARKRFMPLRNTPASSPIGRNTRRHARFAMNLPNEAPRLPLWPFLAGDAILLLAAWLIATQAPSPLDTATLAAIAILVGIGAFVVLIPFLLNYTRRQDMLLIERQNQIAALARDTAAAAEQISIAVGSLHGIAESAARLLKHADQLPARLQEKINEFKTQLNEVAVVENEALAQEINTLRASETERLETALAAIRDAAVELATLETAARQHAVSTKDALAGTSAAARESAAALAAGQALAEKKFAEAQSAAISAIEQAVNRALARLDAGLAKFSKLKFEPPAAAPNPEPPAKAAPNKTPPPPSPPPPPAKPSEPPASEATGNASAPHASTDDALPAPVSPEPSARPSPASLPAPDKPKPSAKSEAPAQKTAPEPAPAPRKSAPPSTPPKNEEPVPPAKAAVATGSATDAAVASRGDSVDKSESVSEPESVSKPESASEPEPAANPGTPRPPAPPPARTRQPVTAKRRSAPRDLPPDEALPGFDLPPSDDFNQDAQEAPELSIAISADGITRLIVTAYIGIGNKLHIRGEGPGLSWDKGVPLQFISIGKWRWECPDADAPVTFKLYKNDEIECAALGRQTLRPGYQHEVPANF
jgi:hypothetical protein